MKAVICSFAAAACVECRAGGAGSFIRHRRDIGRCFFLFHVCPQWRSVNHRGTPEGFSFFKRELHKVGIIQLHVMETDLTLLVCMPAVEQYSSEGGGGPKQLCRERCTPCTPKIVWGRFPFFFFKMLLAHKRLHCAHVQLLHHMMREHVKVLYNRICSCNHGALLDFMTASIKMLSCQKSRHRRHSGASQFSPKTRNLPPAVA